LTRFRAKLGPFRHAPYATYWIGGLLSNSGTWLQTVAGSIFVYQLTGSALMVGLLNFAAFLPILLLSVVGGVLSDRLDRRAIVITTHLISGAFAAVLAVLTFMGVANEFHVIVTAFAINTSYAIAKPALASLLPDLVPREDLTDAIGLNSLQFVSGQLIGPLIATALFVVAGAAWAFAANAMTYVGPILVMVYLFRRGLGGRRRLARDGQSVASMQSAFAYVTAHRWPVYLLAGIVSTSASLEIIRTLAPVLVVQSLNTPESTAGILVAGQSAGSAMGLLLFVPLNRRRLSRQMAAAGLFLQAAGLIAVALSSTLVIAVLAVACIGLGFSLCFPVLTGVLQSTVPNGVLGRVMSYHTLSHLGNRPFTALAAGALATAVGPNTAVLFGLLLAPIGLLAMRRAWDTLRGDPTADPPPNVAIAGARSRPSRA
jgi:MFS family permease